MRPVQQRGQHLAGLVGVVVDGLLAEDHQLRLFLVDQRLQQLGHGQRLQLGVGLDQHAAVGADGHGGAQRLLALRNAARNRHDFSDGTLLFEPGRFFDGDFVKGVHGHLHIGDIHASLIRLDAHLDVVVNDALDRYQHLHPAASKWK
ncbi:hypothetical protein D3C78_1383190 [compost metagenome]